MTTAIRQLVKVDAGGRIAIQSADLREGESAEVIVMVERSNRSESHDRLAALGQFREKMKLTPATAAQWVSDIHAERATQRDPAVTE